MHFNSPLEKQFVSNPIPEGILHGVRSFIAPPVCLAMHEAKPKESNFSNSVLIWLHEGFVACSYFLLCAQNLFLCSHPNPPPPSRTMCAECGHSCWAGLPSVVRVSETPLSRVWYKRGSTLSLDFNAWFYQDIAKATNLLTWLHWMDVARVFFFFFYSESLDFPLAIFHYCCGLHDSCEPRRASMSLMLPRELLLQIWPTLKEREKSFVFFVFFSCSGCFYMDTVFNKLTISL